MAHDKTEKTRHEATLFDDKQEWIVAAIADKKRKPFSGEFAFNGGEPFERFGLATTEDGFQDKVFEACVVRVTKHDRKDLPQMLVDVLKEKANA